MSVLTRLLMRSETLRTTYHVIVTPEDWGDNFDSHYLRRRDAAQAVAKEIGWVVQQLVDDGLDPDAIHVHAKVLSATITTDRAALVGDIPEKIIYRVEPCWDGCDVDAAD
jgi:hypothetical protein